MQICPRNRRRRRPPRCGWSVRFPWADFRWMTDRRNSVEINQFGGRPLCGRCQLHRPARWVRYSSSIGQSTESLGLDIPQRVEQTYDQLSRIVQAGPFGSIASDQPRDPWWRHSAVAGDVGSAASFDDDRGDDQTSLRHPSTVTPTPMPMSCAYVLNHNTVARSTTLVRVFSQVEPASTAGFGPRSPSGRRVSRDRAIHDVVDGVSSRVGAVEIDVMQNPGGVAHHEPEIAVVTIER